MSRKMTRKILVGLVALLCVVLAAGATGCGSGGTASPGQVVEDFWAAVSRGDARAAYDLFSSADQAELPYQEFEKMLVEDPPEEAIKVEIVSENIDGDTAIVKASFEGGTIGFELIKENGSWKLDGIAELLSGASENAVRGECMDNLRTIDGAVMQYSAANNGQYPQTIEELIPNYIRKMPVCPGGGTYIMTTGSRVPDVSCSVHGDY